MKTWKKFSYKSFSENNFSWQRKFLKSLVRNWVFVSFPEKLFSWNFVCVGNSLFFQNLRIIFLSNSGEFFFFGETDWKLSVYVLRNDEKSFFQDTFFFKKHAKNFFQEKHFLGENQVENFFLFLLHAKESFYFHRVKTKWRIWVWIFFSWKDFFIFSFVKLTNRFRRIVCQTK